MVTSCQSIRASGPRPLLATRPFHGSIFKVLELWHELKKAEAYCAKGSALQVAAGEELAPSVEHLIQLGQLTNHGDIDVRTAMHRPAAKIHYQLVEILLEYGADADPNDNVGLKPLQVAVSGNHATVVKVLWKPRRSKTAKDEGRPIGVVW